MLLRPALLLVGLLVAGLGLRLLVAHLGGADALAHTRLPVWALVVAGAAVCAVGLPRQAVCFAAGFACGLWLGLGIALLANVLGCLAGFGAARWLARDRLQLWQRAQWRSGRWKGRVAVLRAHPFATVLTLRLLPVGSSLLINLLAGAAGLRLWPFVAATALGSLPQTVVFTLLGAGTRIGEVGQIAIAVALFAVSGLCGLWLLRRARHLDAA